MAPSEAALNRVLYVLLVVVGYLFVKEIQRAYERRQQALWDDRYIDCLLYTSPSPRDKRQSRMPSSA